MNIMFDKFPYDINANDKSMFAERTNDVLQEALPCLSVRRSKFKLHKRWMLLRVCR